MQLTGTARQIGKRNEHRMRHSFYSESASQVLHFESRIESFLGLLAEYDPRVVSYSPQPISVELNSGYVFNTKSEGVAHLKRLGLSHSTKFYTPDLLCIMHSGARRIYECKHTKFLKNFDLDPVLLETIFEQAGYKFCMITEEFFSPPFSFLHENISILKGAAAPVRLSTDGNVIPQIKEVIGKQALWSLRDLANAAKIPMPLATQAILYGEAGFDLHAEKLNPDSILSSKPHVHAMALLP